MYAGAALHGRAFGVCQSTGRVIVKTPSPTGMVIDGHPKMAMHGVVTPRWYHGVVGHEPRGDAPVVLVVFRIAARANVQTTGGFGHFKDRTQIAQVVLIALGALEQRIGVQAATVQKGNMA